MDKQFKGIVLLVAVFAIFNPSEIKAESPSTGIIQAPSSATSQSTSSASSSPTTNASTSNNTASSNSTVTTASSDTKSSTTASDKSTLSKPVALKPKPKALTPADGLTALGSSGVAVNVHSASVQVEPYSGSAGMSIPIAVPPGRAGIQPNLSINYSSSNRLLGNAGEGWSLDLGSIQISTRKGAPKYDGTDIFTMAASGATQDLVADPTTAGLYHMEVEGSFSNIQYFTDHWVITDKKGIKYYYGNTADSKQIDPANTSHIFRWALNRVEDLNGNYMIISYLQDNGQVYPQTISYTGNDTSSLILSTYAQVNISYVPASSPSLSYISKFLVKTAQRIDHITVSVGPNVQSTYTLAYHQSANSQRDLLQSVQQTGADGSSTLPPVTFTYNEALPQWQPAVGWTIPAGLTTGYFLEYGPSANQGPNAWVDSGLRTIDVDGDGYGDFIQQQYSTTGTTITGVYINNHSATQPGWTLSPTWHMPTNIPGPFSNLEQLGSYYGLSLSDLNGDGLTDIAFDIQWTADPTTELYNTVYLNNGTTGWPQDSTWQLPVYLSQFDSASGLKLSTGAEVVDVDGDGFPDIVQSKGSTQAVYINQYPFGSKTFKQDSTYTFPASNADFTNGAMLVDLNGDGLPDILYRDGTTSHVFMNTGHGWVEDTTSGYNAFPNIGNFKPNTSSNTANTSYNSMTTEMVDVNGDGLPDLIYNDPNNAGVSTILINTGSGWSSEPPEDTGIDFKDRYTQFFDANGDGMMDIMSSSSLFLNQNQPVDLLTGVNNGIGASTTIQYDSDFHYQNTYMPYFLPVVKSTTTTVGSESYTTSYNYAGGLWDKTYHEFDGFNKVTVTDPQGNYVTTTYMQDHWLKGRPIEQDTYDSQGNLYSKTINQWQTQNIASNSNSPVLATFDNAVTYNGNAHLDSSIKKFGASSLGLNSSTQDYVSTPASSDFNFGTGDFTIDCWVYLNSLAPYQAVFGQAFDQTCYALMAFSGSKWEYYVGIPHDNTIAGPLVSTSTVSANTWYHLAIVRSGNVWTLYVNGKAESSGTFNVTYPNYTGPFTVGALYDTFSEWYLNGNIDEFRVSKGIARWTSNFTPPTQDDSGTCDEHTTFLLHFDSTTEPKSPLVVLFT